MASEETNICKLVLEIEQSDIFEVNIRAKNVGECDYMLELMNDSMLISFIFYNCAKFDKFFILGLFGEVFKIICEIGESKVFKKDFVFAYKNKVFKCFIDHNDASILVSYRGNTGKRKECEF